jgi:hypothetical protein
MRFDRVPYLGRGAGGTYFVGGLSLPDWFTKEHAKRIFENTEFHVNMQRIADQIVKDFWFGKFAYKVELQWCDCCGLSYVTVRPGDATSLGIPFHKWPNPIGDDISDHNIDNPTQLIILYSVWAKYLNTIESLDRHKGDGSHS